MISGSQVFRAALLVFGVGLAACNVGPSEERLNCLNWCARAKDQCMLDAMSAEGIQACDVHARQCTEPCPQ